jgi:hypothetical protein
MVHILEDLLMSDITLKQVHSALHNVDLIGTPLSDVTVGDHAAVLVGAYVHDGVTQKLDPKIVVVLDKGKGKEIEKSSSHHTLGTRVWAGYPLKDEVDQLSLWRSTLSECLESRGVDVKGGVSFDQPHMLGSSLMTTAHFWLSVNADALFIHIHKTAKFDLPITIPNIGDWREVVAVNFFDLARIGLEAKFTVTNRLACNEDDFANATSRSGVTIMPVIPPVGSVHVGPIIIDPIEPVQPSHYWVTVCGRLHVSGKIIVSFDARVPSDGGLCQTFRI